MYCMCHYAILPVLSPIAVNVHSAWLDFFETCWTLSCQTHFIVWEVLCRFLCCSWKQAMFSRSGSASSQPAYSLAFLPVYQIRCQDHRPALHVTVFFQIDAFQQQLLEITTKDIGDLWAKLCEAGVPIQTYFTCDYYWWWLLKSAYLVVFIPLCNTNKSTFVTQCRYSNQIHK